MGDEDAVCVVHRTPVTAAIATLDQITPASCTQLPGKWDENTTSVTSDQARDETEEPLYLALNPWIEKQLLQQWADSPHWSRRTSIEPYPRQ